MKSNNRGGKRIGAGRKKLMEPTVQIHRRVPRSLYPACIKAIKTIVQKNKS